MREKCKTFVSRIPRDALIIAVLVLASSASFGLGFLAGVDTGKGSGLEIGQTPMSEVGTPTGNFGVVASKNGTKYYFSQCAGAQKISDTNKVWFASASAAEAAGYTLAANCKGL